MGMIPIYARMIPMKLNRLLLLPLALLSLGALSACGESEPSVQSDFVASIYPAQYLAERISGESVGLLTPAGAEPHDLELTAQDVATIEAAELFIYAHGVQPAVDEAVGDNSFDIAPGFEPHTWLDPQKMLEITDDLTEAMIAAFPDKEATYRENSSKLKDDLAALDAEYSKALATCERKEIISTHNAFVQLAQRYGLVAIPIMGDDPHGEPSAGYLADVTNLIRETKATTIFSEPLAPAEVTETLAAETSVSVAVLDPIEGLTEGSSADYLSLMRANLAAISRGLACG